MKVRELRIRDYRNFRGTTTIQFWDETMGRVRPITVLVGSNGSGKTTVLRLIVDLIGILNRNPPMWDRASDLMAGNVAVWIDGLDVARPFREPADWLIAVGEDAHEFDPPPDNRAALLFPPGKKAYFQENRTWISAMKNGHMGVREGLLFFPHNRWFEQSQKGVIEPISEDKSWIWEFKPTSEWTGSLAQLWVWQNYLDLEQGREGRPNLTPFVETIEEILGQGRRISIKKGLVQIQYPDGRSVEPHQLPSGEQQILTLFGELARQLRPGAIILIDEVEISLHPALQRLVLHHFRRLAEKYDLQFILTTHSMDFVKAAGWHTVVNLDSMALEEQARESG